MYSMARQHCCSFAVVSQSLATLHPPSRHHSACSCQPSPALFSAPSGSGAASGDAQQAAGPDNVPVLPDWVRNRGEQLITIYMRMRWLRERALAAGAVHVHGTVLRHALARHYRCRHAGMRRAGGRALHHLTSPRQQARPASGAGCSLRVLHATPLLCTPFGLAPGCSLPPLHTLAIVPILRPQTAGRTCPWCATLWAAATTCPLTCAHPAAAAAAAALCCCMPRMLARWLAPRPKAQGVGAHRRARLPCLHAGQSHARCLPSSRLPCHACLPLKAALEPSLSIDTQPEYYQRYRICKMHLKSPALLVRSRGCRRVRPCTGCCPQPAWRQRMHAAPPSHGS